MYGINLNALYQYLWIFFIYAFIGWCVEVVFHAVSEGRFINRGFLNGPVCPIYGFGVLIVVLCLEPVKENLLFLFIGSVFLTSALEFLTGFVLERFFNDKWWDYTKEPLNFLGYVCLRFSLVWGLACVLVVDVVYPLTQRFISLISQNVGCFFLGAFLLLTLADASITLAETLKLKKRLIILDNTGKGIRHVSVRIGGVLMEHTLDAMEKLELGIEAAAAGKAHVKYELSVVQSRILSAYPHLRHGRYRDSIKKLRLRVKTDLYHTAPNSPVISRDIANPPLSFYRNTFETVIDVLEARDKYTAGHSRRVEILIKRFCLILGLSPHETEVLELAASLHDLGKVGVPDATLNKRDKLNDAEWSDMRRHPDIGANIIIKSGKLDEVAEFVRSHHEHWDGSGYPAGLRGDEIPKGAQIIAICDATDSMMIERVYRLAFSPDECRLEIKNGRGTLFSPALTDIFLENWSYIVADIYAIGSPAGPQNT